MAKLSLTAIVALMAFSSPASAAYTATGQPCELAPRQNNSEILASCSVEIRNNNVEIVLRGQRPNNVTEVQFLPDSETRLRQTLKLQVSPLIDPETVAIMFVDFNFDGYNDFAIMASLQSGDNVKYLYFLYQPDTGKFSASPAMTPIVNPEVITAQTLIRSFWRETPTRSGWNLWKWKDGVPFVATRIEQTNSASKPCQQITFQYAGNKTTKTPPAPCQ